MVHAGVELLFLRKLVSFLFIGCFYTYLLGQQQIFYFHTISEFDRLSVQNFNKDILRDRSGFIWISSSNGLNRFDGTNVKTYFPSTSDSLYSSDSFIQKGFYEDSQENIWFNTAKTIQFYQRKSDNLQTAKIAGVKRSEIRTLQLLDYNPKDDNFLLYLNDSLFIYDPQQNGERTYIDTLRTNYGYEFGVKKLDGYRSFLLAIPQSDGCLLNKYKGAEKISNKVKITGNLGDFKTWSCYFENEDLLWINSDRGLIEYQISKKSKKIFNKFQDKLITGVNRTIYVNQDFNLVSTKQNGIYYFNKTNRKFSHQIFLLENEGISPFNYPIDNIYVDQDQNLWISTSGNGIFFTNLKSRKFQSILPRLSERDPKSSYVQSITTDTQGRIWCLTQDGVKTLTYHEGEYSQGESYVGPGSIFRRTEPFHIFCDSKDRIWACVLEGLYLKKPHQNTFEKIPNPANVPSKDFAFTFVNELSNNRILVSTFNSGMFEAKQIENSPILYPLPEINDVRNRFTMNYEDDQGNVYFSKANDSLLIFSQKLNQLIKDTAFAITPMIHGFAEDRKNGNLWIASSFGLYKLTQTDNQYKLERDSLVNNFALKGILLDNNQLLWMSTNQGIISYDYLKKEIRNYSLTDGLIGLQFNYISFVASRSREFLFGGVNGISVFNPNDIEQLKIRATPTITELLINYEIPNQLECTLTKVQNISKIKRLVLPYDQNTITFRFSAMDYSDPGANEFKYRLIGKEADWTPATKNLSERYSQLSPGSYTFEVMASNSDGIWSDNESTIEIIITPPWYQTWWFYTLCTLAALLLLYLLYRYRVQQIQRREAFKRKEAEYKTLVAETETAVLRLQMNPHFIFNSMNSISSYILQRDIETANSYLLRFSKLMRMILDLAAQPYITVGEEAELLEKYLEAEAMRLEKRFDYQLDVAKDLDPDDIILPTMILQPFVENAIWHGMRQKESQGMIKVSFALEGEELLCAVEDNGIGRKAASQNLPLHKSHVSRALEITRKRLDLLKDEHKKEASYEVIDLKDEHGKALGTKVVLRLPVL